MGPLLFGMWVERGTESFAFVYTIRSGRGICEDLPEHEQRSKIDDGVFICRTAENEDMTRERKQSCK